MAGYNTMEATKKERLDPRKVSGYTGLLLLVSGAFLLLTAGLYLLYPRGWIISASWIMFGMIVIGGMILINLGETLLKDEYKSRETPRSE